MKTEQYLNSPEKGCRNCAHRVGIHNGYAKCDLTGFYCDLSRQYAKNLACDENLSGWKKRAPRRSLELMRRHG
jgi:hypothetical protein